MGRVGAGTFGARLKACSAKGRFWRAKRDGHRSTEDAEEAFSRSRSSACLPQALFIIAKPSQKCSFFLLTHRRTETSSSSVGSPLAEASSGSLPSGVILSTASGSSRARRRNNSSRDSPSLLRQGRQSSLINRGLYLMRLDPFARPIFHPTIDLVAAPSVSEAVQNFTQTTVGTERLRDGIQECTTRRGLSGSLEGCVALPSHVPIFSRF